MGPSLRSSLLAVVVGLVLADSSIVTLGLPDILDEFDASPESVAWVLISFNLVLAVLAVPSARVALRAHASTVTAVGIGVFAAASLACALAPSLGFLIGARCIQGLGGAAVVCGALDLLVATMRSRDGAITRWGIAGAIGAAIGPAIGGALTDILSWEAIFLAQVPVALACLPAAIGVRGASEQPAAQAAADTGRETTDRATVPLLALGLLSGGLAGALFLLVLLLVEGWQLSPLTAALTVSIMPVAALLAGAAGRRLSVPVRATAGSVLVSGGLAALALVPAADVWATVAPQLAIGTGLGLALSALSDATVQGRRPLGLHGGWSIASRHAGIVIALAIVTPLFTSQLDEQRVRAEIAGTAAVLDAPISADTKISVALALAEAVRRAGDELPELDRAFAAQEPSPEERPALRELQADLEQQLEQAATAAFRSSFWVAAGLALLALLPLAAGRDLRPRALAAGTAPVALLLAAYVAAGGVSYEPPAPADPCEPRPTRPEGMRFATLERIGLEALDRAACSLDVSRERLLLALTDAQELPEDITTEERNDALTEALRGALDAAEQRGQLSGLEAFALRQAINFLGVDALLDRFFGG